jgi:hypothetical protein
MSDGTVHSTHHYSLCLAHHSPFDILNLMPSYFISDVARIVNGCMSLRTMSFTSMQNRRLISFKGLLPTIQYPGELRVCQASIPIVDDNENNYSCRLSVTIVDSCEYPYRYLRTSQGHRPRLAKGFSNLVVSRKHLVENNERDFLPLLSRNRLARLITFIFATQMIFHSGTGERFS